MNIPVLLIAAHNQRGYIGSGGDLMYKLPYDMRNFKEQTMGCPVIMGRKTWDSMGGPLPGRFSIVLTRNSDFFSDHHDDDSDLMTAECTIDGAINKAKQVIKDHNMKPYIWVIGGADIYELAMPFATGAVLTLVEDDKEGDTKFPFVEFNKQFVEIEEGFETTRDNGFDIEITHYKRSTYSDKAQGLLWNVPDDRKPSKTVERDGLVVRLSSIDAFNLTAGAPVINLWINGKSHGYRFESREEAEVALHQLNDLMNDL